MQSMDSLLLVSGRSVSSNSRDDILNTGLHWVWLGKEYINVETDCVGIYSAF